VGIYRQGCLFWRHVESAGRTRGEAFLRCIAARSPEEWMRLRCAPSEAPGMHTGALLCLGPPPASRPAASCRAADDKLHAAPSSLYYTELH
jgi:hypothetical protein